MPRTLDVDLRDRVVVTAAWRVIERDGMAALTVRAVAAEAGLPPSSLRTTFPSQAGVRRAAVLEAIEQRRRRLAAAPDARALLLALLPMDPVRRTEAAVLLALRAGGGDPALAGLREEADEVVLLACEEAVRTLGADDPLLAQLLHAVVDGLALRLLQDADAAEHAVLAVERLLETATTDDRCPAPVLA